MLEVAIKTLPDKVVLPLTDKLPVKDVLPLTLNAAALLPVNNKEPDNKVEPVICVLPLCNKLPDNIVLPLCNKLPVKAVLPLTDKLPDNAVLPLTLRALPPLPVTISDPDTVPDPVNGKAPIPVNPDPSPINDPLTVPLTNKLPVSVVLPLTLNAGPPLPVTIREPDSA